MHNEDKAAANIDRSREFGVFGGVLRELQKEELKEVETCLIEIQENGTAQNMLQIMSEINATLKEIAETQKKILEEIQKKINE